MKNNLHLYSTHPNNRKIYCSEAYKICSYAEANDREFFAEAFHLYFTDPQILKLFSPCTYNRLMSQWLYFLLNNAHIARFFNYIQ